VRVDGLTRDRYGKRTDKTGERDLVFSQWHRRYLSNRCYATDIDFFEYRIENGKIVPKAFLEVKQAHVRQKKYLCSSNTRAILHIAQALGIPFFIILYEQIDPKTGACMFWVWQVRDEAELSRYSDLRFDEFFRAYTNEELVELLEGL